jgi:hypothetical protein
VNQIGDIHRLAGAQNVPEAVVEERIQNGDQGTEKENGSARIERHGVPEVQ